MQYFSDTHRHDVAMFEKRYRASRPKRSRLFDAVMSNDK